MELGRVLDKHSSVVSVTSINTEKANSTKTSLVDKFLSTATVHGAAKIHEAEKARSRLFWTCILLTLLSTFTYFSYKNFDRYFQFDVKISTTYADNKGVMGFPAVTFCNSNRVSLRVFQEIFGVDKKDITLKYCQNMNVAKGKLTNQTILTKLSYMDNFFVPFSCRFNDIPCTFDGTTFVRSETIVYGTCFTFNLYGNYTQTIPGPVNGLQIIANINQFDYFPCDFFYNVKPAGVYVLIHSPNSTPDYRIPIVASPGELTMIDLGKTYINREPDPYVDNCRKVGDTSKDEYPILTHSTYSLDHCYYSCYIFKMNESCGEVDYESAFIAMRHNVTFKFNSTVIPVCIEKFKGKFNDGKVTCMCRPLCEENDYIYTVKPSPWPTDVTMDTWIYEISQLNKQPPTEENVRKNAAAIQIYFSHFKVLKTIHSPAYEFGAMFSDIGGLSGLFIGASIFSLFEFMVLVLNYSRDKLKKFEKK